MFYKIIIGLVFAIMAILIIGLATMVINWSIDDLCSRANMSIERCQYETR